MGKIPRFLRTYVQLEAPIALVSFPMSIEHLSTPVLDPRHLGAEPFPNSAELPFAP